MTLDPRQISVAKAERERLVREHPEDYYTPTTATLIISERWRRTR
ncbi:MAG: hypothetical protein M2R45_05014 [Verrucomicrobia subdivision 3 bacterium]|nr:hypothetical protein [Limisphaerales bacterium]MCS1417659.1 hypothetical protein [Limisphaerales bacterium]